MNIRSSRKKDKKKHFSKDKENIKKNRRKDKSILQEGLFLVIKWFKEQIVYMKHLLSLKILNKKKKEGFQIFLFSFSERIDQNNQRKISFIFNL